MECPRCGSDLVAFAVAGGDGETVACETCGYLDSPLDLHVERRPGEDWAEALARFREEQDESIDS
ncbi:hypothetical protein [Haloglomus litoreum]|uniref:hypothetical protein n=1 Tax=Haloglomus litoreum TaxID=3034026 RepID=UPI0023E877BB|nr:hypothetical protein [Haloglomus sp. DT116]